MQINFTGHGISISPALREFTQHKLSRLERHFSPIISVHVTLSVDKLNHLAEATVSVSKAELHASAVSHDMYIAIDELEHKLDAQLIKHKEKMRDHRDHE